MMPARKQKSAASEDEAGITRTRDGWEAYVLPGSRFVKLGTFATKAQARAARRKYWEAREAKGQPR